MKVTNFSMFLREEPFRKIKIISNWGGDVQRYYVTKEENFDDSLN